jgi:8-oxo-dGTP pyrophosphatase MutT (NUDIX family)
MEFISLWLTISVNEETPVEMVQGKHYDEALKEEPDNQSYKTIDVKQLDMRLKEFVHVFEQHEHEHFLGKANTHLPYYTYFDFASQKRLAQPITLRDATGNKVQEEAFLPQAKDGVKNVVAVIVCAEEGSLKMAVHRHEEGNLFGYPDIFDAPPGGRLDNGHSSLTTALIESYEELGYQPPVRSGDQLVGYIKHEMNLFIFFLLKQNHLKTCASSAYKPSFEMGFMPFTLRVVSDEAKLKQELEKIACTVPSKDWVSEVAKAKKNHTKKVLIPRPNGLYDSVSVSMEKVDFTNPLALVNDSPGRFCSFVHGFPIWKGLDEIQKIIFKP